MAANIIAIDIIYISRDSHHRVNVFFPEVLTKQ